MSNVPSGIVNRETGKPPTPAEWERIKARAIEIFRSPYAAPELQEWAIEMYPEGFVEAFEFRVTDYRHWPQNQGEKYLEPPLP